MGLHKDPKFRRAIVRFENGKEMVIPDSYEPEKFQVKEKPPSFEELKKKEKANEVKREPTKAELREQKF